MSTHSLALRWAPVLLLALSACQPPPPDEQEAVSAQAQRAAAAATAAAPSAPPIGSCDATQAQALIGQPLTDTLTAQARQDTHSRSVRVLQPGQPATLEFDGERLTLELDHKRAISGVRCG